MGLVKHWRIEIKQTSIVNLQRYIESFKVLLEWEFYTDNYPGLPQILRMCEDELKNKERSKNEIS